MTDVTLSSDVVDFVAGVKRDATLAFDILERTGVLSPTRTIGFIERVPGHDLVVSAGYPNRWAGKTEVEPGVVGFDGLARSGDPRAGGAGRYLKLFRAHPEITTVVHVHTPYLGAWSQSHRSLPILYVPVQRHTLTREIPIYVDRRQAEVDYILERLEEDAGLHAILEANGGATVWGREGLLKTAQSILILEEGAKFQAIAEGLGGSKPYGPGVLEQQWRMSGLLAAAAE